ncbi:MAG TPA: TIGR02147 family protein [Pseudobdellovibrionaceae bacterium]|nr:TIGR02147 family protein [Pseudobdellovibrionaceae bacterium]
MILEYSDYRSFLKNLIAHKKQQNPSYSMRAFSRHIGIGQSALSQVLAGKKNLSIERATMIANKLNLNFAEAEYFRTLIQIEGTRNSELKQSLIQRAQSLNPQREVRQLSVDVFSYISDWYHLVIKNMVGLDHFDFNSKNIASHLGISNFEVEEALQRIHRLEMIEPDPEQKGRYLKVQDYTLTQSAVPNEALKKFHRQMLLKAIDSLETQTPKEKFIGSETFAISEELLPKAFEMADRFLTAMAALSEESAQNAKAPKSKEPKQVYHVGVQLFNTMKKQRKNK